MNVPEVVVQKVASQEEVPPTDLPSLYHTIDPDALNAMIRSMSDDDGVVKFQYAGCFVTVNGDGIVSVTQNRSA